jgi:hypothetical protein
MEEFIASVADQHLQELLDLAARVRFIDLLELPLHVVSVVQIGDQDHFTGLRCREIPVVIGPVIESKT